MSSKIRVLVVDDEAAILRFLKPALEANNYELLSAGTVEEATRRIAADTPDIVVLDLGLPDGDGKDVIRAVRKWSTVPIIVLSARDREAEKIEALDLEVRRHISIFRMATCRQEFHSGWHSARQNFIENGSRRFQLPAIAVLSRRSHRSQTSCRETFVDFVSLRKNVRRIA